MSGFVSGIVLGRSVHDATLLGSATSNACIRKIGATSGACPLEEADNITKKHLDGVLI